MSERQCPGCAQPYRRGTVVTLLLISGETRRARVCPRCVSRALVIVSELHAVIKAIEDTP